MNIDETIGANVHQQMWRARFSQVQLAGALGLDQAAVSRRLRGRTPWKASEVLAAAELLGVDVADLYRDNPSVTATGTDPAMDGGGEATSGYRSVVGGDAYCPPLHAVDLLLDPFPLQIPTAS